jgi:thymidylate synthase (FAD)
MRLITAPTVTLVADPRFHEPEHLRVEWLEPGTDAECLSEYAGRLCYMSQRNPAERTTKDYLANIRKLAHGSVFEHAVFVLLIEGISRSCSHELVRHRAGCGYSQLSQRYVNQTDLGFVVPPAYLALGEATATYQGFVGSCERQAKEYARQVEMHEAELGPNPTTIQRKRVREAARSVLGNDAETKLLMSANVRAWRTVLEQRCGEGAELEIRRLFTNHVLSVLGTHSPYFFDDFEIYRAEDGIMAARPQYHKV